MCIKSNAKRKYIATTKVLVYETFLLVKLYSNNVQSLLSVLLLSDLMFMVIQEYG